MGGAAIENRFCSVGLRPGNRKGQSSQLGPPNHASSHFLKVIICFLQLKSILLCFFKLFDGETDNIIINISVIWFGKKSGKIIYIIPTRKQVKSDPEAFLESGSETRMFSILLLWTPSLKYCSKLKGEYKNSKSGSGTSVGPSLTTLGLSLKTILVTLSL